MMVRAHVAILLVATACAGGPDPTGDWTGDLLFETTEGGAFSNSLSVEADGTGTVVLYATLEVPDEDGRGSTVVLQEFPFDLVWFSDESGVSYGLTCKQEDCLYNPAMDCTIEEPRQSCDLLPDLYADDEEVLQWMRVG
jgi:hypothetical protein